MKIAEQTKQVHRDNHQMYLSIFNILGITATFEQQSGANTTIKIWKQTTKKYLYKSSEYYLWKFVKTSLKIKLGL